MAPKTSNIEAWSKVTPWGENALVMQGPKMRWHVLKFRHSHTGYITCILKT